MIFNEINIALLILAFGAGVSVFFSPCGIALLPSYIAFLIAKKESKDWSKGARALEGLKIGLIVSFGIITVFLGLGILISLVGNILAPYAFWFGTITGALLIILGIFMLAGKSLNIPQFRIKTDNSPSLKTYYLFGLVYALGGIACTLGVFLFVVSAALSIGSFGGALINFISFTAGSVILMVSITVLSAVAKSLVSRWLIRYIRPVQIIAALIVIVGGSYLIFFNLRAFIF